MRVEVKELRPVAARFMAALLTEARERDNRMEVDDWGDGHEIRFAWCERHRMHREVNTVRAAAGLDVVPVDAVRRVEQLALGHVDYGRKFTWYCAELALGAEGVRP